MECSVNISSFIMKPDFYPVENGKIISFLAKQGQVISWFSNLGMKPTFSAYLELQQTALFM